MTSEEISAYITNKRQIVDKHLDKLFKLEESDTKSAKLHSAMKYTVLSKGKRLRPIMAIATYEMFQDDNKEITGPACAVELIHAGSLMLDDLPCMDNALYRRGEKTSHRVYGESTTLLASAGLWAKAFGILSETKKDSIKDLVLETTKSIGYQGLIRGQYFDLNSFEKEKAISQLEECYKLKTGALFKLAVKTGAILGGAEKREIATLERFGDTFGVAFQIRDDIIDKEFSENESGKDKNTDEKNKKANFVSILGLIETKRLLKDKIEDAVCELEKLERNSVILKKITEGLFIT